MHNVRIEQGLICGAERDGVFRFLGLPYAAPPVGDLRWAPPGPPVPWESVREATAFGNSAIQIQDTGFDPGSPQSEDCLNLNVWSTTLDNGAAQPVMVWIHGGGFLNGSASMDLWQGQNLAKRGVTVVSLNYRLGAFGFLAHPEIGCNFAVQDWVAALTWVKANIRAFGGDPGNVTVFGQSAGGAASRALLCTPAARGLFHRAVIQSAGYEDYAHVASPSYQRAADATQKLFGLLGTHDLDELRALPAEKVRQASLATAGTTPPPGQVHTPANLVWYPAADGQVMTEDFTGWAEDVSVLVGCTQDEARMFIGPTGIYGHPELDPDQVYSPDTLTHVAKALGGAQADELLAHFAASGQSVYESLAELITTAVWIEPSVASLQRYAAEGRPAYLYRFARVSPGARDSGKLAYHSAEIPYLFGGVTPGGDYDQSDVAVSDTVQHAWTTFARTGIPTNPDGTPWPACATTDPHLVVIDTTTDSRPLELSPVTQMINSLRR